MCPPSVQSRLYSLPIKSYQHFFNLTVLSCVKLIKAMLPEWHHGNWLIAPHLDQCSKEATVYIFTILNLHFGHGLIKLHRMTFVHQTFFDEVYYTLNHCHMEMTNSMNIQSRRSLGWVPMCGTCACAIHENQKFGTFWWGHFTRSSVTCSSACIHLASAQTGHSAK